MKIWKAFELIRRENFHKCKEKHVQLVSSQCSVSYNFLIKTKLDISVSKFYCSPTRKTSNSAHFKLYPLFSTLKKFIFWAIKKNFLIPSFLPFTYKYKFCYIQSRIIFFNDRSCKFEYTNVLNNEYFQMWKDYYLMKIFLILISRLLLINGTLHKILKNM